MELTRFFPYRLAVLSEQVSRCMAQVYDERFDLGRDEWRVLAALYEQPTLKTTDVIATTTLDKMQASRAVARLEAAGLISRTADGSDRRHRVLRLLPAGRALVKKIIPLVQAREAFLLEGLDAQEREVLDRVLTTLTERARQLVQQG
jgi:DNA-binding MarR family transcriptional regulator